MSLDYETYPLKELNEGASVFSGFAFKSKDFSDKGIPIVKIKNIQNKSVDLKEVQYFPLDKVNNKHKKFFLKNNDVLIAMTGQGSLGRVGRINLESNEYVLLNQRVGKFVVDEKNLHLNYLYHVISSDMYEKILFDRGTGSGQPNLSPEIILGTEIPMPNLTTQKKISSILDNINSKINLNKKINKNLEELMHVLFKKYFIDNNPFYVENDEKWNIIKLKDLIIRNRDKINDFDNWKDELLIDLSNMPRFSIAISNFDKGKKFTSNIYKLNKYDLLFGSIRPYFGKVGFSPINGVVTGTVHSFKPIDDIYYSLVLSLISSKTFINYTVSVSKGTKMPSVKWDDFINYEFAIPDDLSKIGEYNKILLPLIHKIEKNILEIQRLTKLRDTLLPKLMSGEIDVSKINCDLE
ncbi:restriction endonuclease subunit S [Methanobrevibacter smithii]|uniref:restriction endonuclease subunit S n=1 Tax=Methanobrevibacter smithii TaxID=2173 RepID=UPI0037DD7E17